MDFPVPVDKRVKMKESKKIQSFHEEGKAKEDEGYDETNGSSWNDSQRFVK